VSTAVWLRPRDLDEAVAGLRGGRTVVGGGAALASESFAPRIGDRALDLAGLGLDRIDGGHIGAMTTLQRLLDDDVLGDWPALGEAVRSVGTPEVRRIATVGGSIAALLPTSDLLPALCALRARIDLLEVSGGRHPIALSDYVKRPRTGIVLGVHLGAARRGAFRRLAGRAGFAPSIASVAAVAHPDGVELWAGAVADTPVRLTGGELPPESALRDDHIAAAWYRRRLIAVLRDEVLAALGPTE